MSKTIYLKRGLNINLAGEAEKAIDSAFTATCCAVKPGDFKGMSPIPKLLVAEGDQVKAGTPLFFDKVRPEIIITSPVSGTIKSIVRGDKRAVEAIIIEKGKEHEYVQFDVKSPKEYSREELIELLLKSGLWMYIRQRPFDIIAQPQYKPKAIVISAFDTAPLAPDMDFVVHGKGEVFQLGLDALSMLTDGIIHLNVQEGGTLTKVFLNSKGVQINRFAGPHPAGNVGIQIHHLDPINKGEKVWYLTPQDVIIIGRFFQKGIYDSTKLIALTGSEVKLPKYYKTFTGACIKAMVENNVKEGHLRFISGNVLTGTKISTDGYIGFYDSQITVIPEGDQYEFLGWLMPGFGKFSMSRTFPSFLMPGKKYSLDTNFHGEERAFVMSGQYEKVLPMDIYPVHLLKAIITGNIDKMEQLGIYEVSEEDFALCEFVCTSKIEVQQLIRQGLEMIRKEME